ncbi:hypothetical protein AVW11_27800 [Streptomyces amritsarensis]|uniref:Uncharacterized protein n=1 Tax=Streptomyces amritsarensis TaxID=681158 RepID=A0ABX3FVV5_9ACTN|nr:hypothetical protein [Streptomyces amritsarensis]OLZ58564.1 hypothetical protein AVW11_27800 [Streptomyces amritsarensis]
MGRFVLFVVVPGSGTVDLVDLVGLAGSGGFAHRHGDTCVAYSFAYALACTAPGRAGGRGPVRSAPPGVGRPQVTARRR